jgi:arylsulfatase A-like enzyme
MFLRLLLALFALATLALAAPPNIVYIMADDLGVGGVSCYGQKKYETPNIDRLAREGMRFTTAYSGSHVCAPSRSSLMTGLHTGHTPVRANGKNRFLYDEDVTIAELLKTRGYATGGFGKWGLGLENTPGVAVKQGFDEWSGQYSQHHAHFYYPFWIWKGLEKRALTENEGGKRGRYIFDDTHAHALEFIRRHQHGPFFAYLPYIIPHVELVVPEEDEKPFRDKFPKVPMPDPRPGYIGSEHGYATYAGMVTRLDRAVGEVLALLRELGLDENTLVIFTSDNGAQGGGVWDQLVEFFDGTAGLRGSKGMFYEGGLRVPFIARWPGKIQAGATTDLPIAFWDLMPTLCEIAGAPAPAQTDGLSLAPTLLGRGEQKRHHFFYWEYPVPAGLTQSVRMGDWKGVKAKARGPWELYDLKADPKEERDVAADRPDVVAKLQEIAAREHTPEREYEELKPESKLSDYVR